MSAFSSFYEKNNVEDGSKTAETNDQQHADDNVIGSTQGNVKMGTTRSDTTTRSNSSSSRSDDDDQEDHDDDGGDDEQSRLKREKRLAMNRASARSRRKRKRDLMQALETRVLQLSRHLAVLQEKHEGLQVYVGKLETELVQAHATLAGVLGGGAAPPPPLPVPPLPPPPLPPLVRGGGAGMEQERFRSLLEMVQRGDSALPANANNRPPLFSQEDPHLQRQLFQLELAARQQPLLPPTSPPPLPRPPPPVADMVGSALLYEQNVQASRAVALPRDPFFATAAGAGRGGGGGGGMVRAGNFDTNDVLTHASSLFVLLVE